MLPQKNIGNLRLHESVSEAFWLLFGADLWFTYLSTDIQILKIMVIVWTYGNMRGLRPPPPPPGHFPALVQRTCPRCHAPVLQCRSMGRSLKVYIIQVYYYKQGGSFRSPDPLLHPIRFNSISSIIIMPAYMLLKCCKQARAVIEQTLQACHINLLTLFKPQVRCSPKGAHFARLYN